MALSFKEYLLETSQYSNIVIEPNTGRGRGVVVYGYIKRNGKVSRTLIDDFNTLSDARIEYPTASVTASEEEESKMPVRRDREMVSQGIRNRTSNERGGIRSNKRNAQRTGRYQRSMHGKGTGGGNYMDNLFGDGGRPEDY